MMVTTEPASSTLSTQFDALLHHVALAPLDEQGWLRVTGFDRVRWLNGMVTNSIQALAPGQGCYNFFLNAQGRIQGTATAFAVGDGVVLQTDRAQVTTLVALLDRFIIMDDVELADTSDRWRGLAVIGPEAGTLLAGIDIAPPPPALALATQQWRGEPLSVIAAHSPLIPRFELWAASDTIANLTQTLTGTPSAEAATLEALRVLEGTPRYGADIRNSDTARDLPQETNQTRALHFAKGCYLGQEIVERIRSRGQVHRTFTGFRLEGVLPAAGTPFQADGKTVGEMTSIAVIPRQIGPQHLALGYIRREALERNATLTYPGGQAVPTSLPFPI